MQFSAFTPLGLFQFSSQRPRAQLIYEALVSAHGGEFDLSPGSHQGAKVYAWAMQLARAEATLRYATHQREPMLAYEGLPRLELDYHVVPRATATLDERRRTVAARKAITQGATKEGLETALSALLGADFVAVRACTEAERVNSPALDDPHPPANFADPGRPARIYRLTTRITALYPVDHYSGAVFSYVPIEPGNTELLAVGDRIAIETEHAGRAESTQILSLASDTKWPSAHFRKTHPAGVTITTGPTPIAASSQRFFLIVVSHAAVADSEKRRRINDLMSRVARAVGQWAIVEESAPGVVGPMRAGGRVGVTPIGQLTL